MERETSLSPEGKLYSIFIINKAGGLIFHRVCCRFVACRPMFILQDFLNRKIRLTSNAYLQIGIISFYFAIISLTFSWSISCHVCDCKPTGTDQTSFFRYGIEFEFYSEYVLIESGLTSFESDDMRLRCFQSVTGIISFRIDEL
jgi:hypothetical protein